MHSSQPQREPRGIGLICVLPHSAGPPRSPRKWRQQIAAPQRAPRGGGRRQEGGGREEAGGEEETRPECSIQNEYPTKGGLGTITQGRTQPMCNKWHNQVAIPLRINIRWTSQEPTKMATAAQLAAFLGTSDSTSAGPPRSPQGRRASCFFPLRPPAGQRQALRLRSSAMR